MKKDNAMAHGCGAGLLAVLGMLGRCADDAARIGVSSVDDIGRACIRSTDDIGSLTSRSSDELLRPIDDFHTAKYVDELRFESPVRRVALNESDESVSHTPHIAKDVVEATFKIIDLNRNEDDK